MVQRIVFEEYAGASLLSRVLLCRTYQQLLMHVGCGEGSGKFLAEELDEATGGMIDGRDRYAGFSSSAS
jgi:hypothetical protein